MQLPNPVLEERDLLSSRPDRSQRSAATPPPDASRADPGFDPIRPARVRYIKLGQNGRWETRALTEGKLFWGIASDPVQEAAAGAWELVETRFRDMTEHKSTATGWLRELREFFTFGEDTLWITFAGGQMWWAFSERAQVAAAATDSDPAAFRRTLAPWRNTDRFDRPLDQAGLSTKLTQVAGYRRSICGVEHADYAVRRINGEEEANVTLLRVRRAGLIEAAADLIRDLHWRDFELLVDLLFAHGGWRRVSELGGTMKDIDLLLEQPVTGERISVQVKSSIDQVVAEGCFSAFANGGAADRFFLVYHTGKAAPPAPGARPVHLWGSAELARHAVDAGLTEWLAARAG